MLQASLFDCLSFDPFSVQQDGLAPSEVDVCRSQIAQALVIAVVVVVGDEGLDLSLEVARQIVVLQQDPVLQRLVPSLDLALGLRVIGGAANALDDISSAINKKDGRVVRYPVVEPRFEQGSDE